jgi:hypothetical protein
MELGLRADRLEAMDTQNGSLERFSKTREGFPFGLNQRISVG